MCVPHFFASPGNTCDASVYLVVLCEFAAWLCYMYLCSIRVANLMRMFSASVCDLSIYICFFLSHGALSSPGHCSSFTYCLRQSLFTYAVITAMLYFLQRVEVL